MKVISILLLILLPLIFLGQSPPESLAKTYKLNFAIPDYPAFKALDTEPSNILRPSSNQSFGFISSEALNNRLLTIPKSFAVEINPMLLMNMNSMRLETYQNNYSWMNSRISLGAIRDSLNTTKLSLGYRISLIDKGDSYKDK
jgi:hypothetical protein